MVCCSAYLTEPARIRPWAGMTTSNYDAYLQIERHGDDGDPQVPSIDRNPGCQPVRLRADFVRTNFMTGRSRASMME